MPKLVSGVLACGGVSLWGPIHRVNGNGLGPQIKVCGKPTQWP